MENGDRELGTGHAGEPQSEVPVDLVSIYLLNESLESRHPGGREMAVLEEHPATSVHGLLHHPLCSWSLHTVNIVIATVPFMLSSNIDEVPNSRRNVRTTVSIIVVMSRDIKYILLGKSLLYMHA